METMAECKKSETPDAVSSRLGIPQPQLQFLFLDGNNISGSITGATLEGFLNLEALGLSSNLLSGAFPSAICRLHRLRDLWINHNQFTGQFPLSSLRKLSNLQCVGLNCNHFHPAPTVSDIQALGLQHHDLP